MFVVTLGNVTWGNVLFVQLCVLIESSEIDLITDSISVETEEMFSSFN